VQRKLNAARAATRPDAYWAAEPDPQRLAAALVDRISRYYDDCRTAGRVEIWRRIRDLSFGRDPDGDRTTFRVSFTGEQGETTEIRINHFRNLLDHVYAITTQTRPAFESKADNGDSRTLAERQIADAIIDHHLNEPYGLEYEAKAAARYAIHLCEGYLYQWWDEDAGEADKVEPYLSAEDQAKADEYNAEADDYERQVAMLSDASVPANDNGGGAALPEPPQEPEVTWLERLKYTGAPRFLALPPEDLIRDPDLESAKWQWVMVRRQASRWDLAAQFPQSAPDILGDETDRKRDLGLRRVRAHSTGGDQVEIFEFFHSQTPAMPQGRWAILVGEVVIHDGPNPYRALPVHSMVPGHEFQEPYGYGASMDLLAIQQIRDGVASCIVSNIAALGVQKVWSQDDVETFDLGHGLMHVKSGTKPEGLKLLESTETQEKALEWLRTEGELTSGINATTRGEPPSNIKSGVSQAFAHSMSIQANAPVQWAWAAFLQAAATGLIQLYQDFAQSPRIIEIAGKGKAYQASQFTAEDIGGIRSVSVNLGNPLMRTTAGRAEVAQMFFDKQVISPQQYFALIETGRLEDITESAEAFRLLIAAENEKLRSGTDENGAPVEVLVSKYDRHHEHIVEHLAILADPMIRYDQAIVARVFQTIEAHRYWWAYLTQLEPDCMAALGIPPAPPTMAPLMPPPDAARVGAQPIMPPPPPMPIGPDGKPIPPPAGGPPGPANDNGGPSPANDNGAPQPGPGMPSLPAGAQVPPEVAAQATNPGMTM
jgi:hypothetical protein